MSKKDPLWWLKISRDLRMASKTAARSFEDPGVIIGFEADENDTKINYFIRLNTGKVGSFSRKSLGNKDLLTGIKIKNTLPEPQEIIDDPDIGTFTFEVLREQIKLLPRLWLKRNISLLLNNKEINAPSMTFSNWVLLSPKKRQDRYLTNLLESAVKYEGLKGLARFNDYAS